VTGSYAGIVISGSRSAVIANEITDTVRDGITVTGSDCSFIGNTLYSIGRDGISLNNSYRSNLTGNKIDSVDTGNTGLYSGIYSLSNYDCEFNDNVITNSLAQTCRYGINLVDYTERCFAQGNHIRGYARGISIGATVRNIDNMVKHNFLLNNTICFYDGGVNTKIQSVMVPFSHGNDPQDSGFLVDSTNGGDDYARAFTMLPAELQQLMRAKVYARSSATETHSMEADFTVYGAADNEVYTTHNGSIASLASTSINFTADDVIYWMLTTAGLLAMLAKDSVELKVDYAAADGDNCATAAYFRTVEIEYV
jgi:hypothetical protein